ncbi:MAG: DUF5103 domain-containing protein [Bacteroidales bacterium]|nr:DUF5103 domain-containing protein [Bacteroidales bacterium]
MGNVAFKYRLILGLLVVFGNSIAHGQICKDSSWNDAIKTVFLNKNGIEQETPILGIESNDFLMLQFDYLSENAGDFRYRITHCDANWNPDGLEPSEYINGFEEGAVDNYKFSFTTMHPFVYYSQRIPAEYTSFITSGNFLITVFPTDYPDSIVLTRRFMVTEDIVDIEASVGKPTGGYGDFNRDQELNFGIQKKESSRFDFQQQYATVITWQNGRNDLRREMPFSGYQGEKVMYRWKRENIFPGGSSFRYFDCSNLRAKMYNIQNIEEFGGETLIFLRPEEDRSRKNYIYTKGLLGGMKINAFDRNDAQTQGDYVWANFSLPVERPFIDGSLHIIGDLTDWSFDENSRMEWHPEYKAYTKRMLVKQGYYSYQIIFLPTGEKEGQTSRIEGDHFETPNRYTIACYYRLPYEKHDRLIAIKQVYSGR